MATARPLMPQPEPGPTEQEVSAPAAVVHHADMRFVPDGMVIWAVHPDRPGDGNLVYTGGQLLPDWIRGALAGGAALVPGPAGVLVLTGGKGGKR